jgi:hypothetical protein
MPEARKAAAMRPINGAAGAPILVLSLLGVGLSTLAIAQVSERKQVCEGVVALDADGTLQLTDTKTSASPWCDASIGQDKNSAIAKRVLSQCSVGSRCVIDGLFSGHGAFSWTKIISVRQK